MRKLKRKVKNKAYFEGSIAKSYIIEEISTFCSHYFDANVDTNLIQVDRNDDGGTVDSDGCLSIFSHPGRPFGEKKSHILTPEEYAQARLYALLNCDEVEPYVK